MKLEKDTLSAAVRGGSPLNITNTTRSQYDADGEGGLAKGKRVYNDERRPRGEDDW